MHLGPAGDAGFDFVTEHVTRLVLFVVVVVGHCMGPGSDDGHAPLQYVDELRQFVQAGAPQESTQGGDARVALGGLGDLAVVFLVHVHAAEFVDLDDAAVPAIALLPEVNRAGTGDFDSDGDGQHEWADEDQDDEGEHAVFDRFDDPGGAGDGRC